MTSRVVTLAGYAVLAAAAVGLEILAWTTGRVCRLTDAVAAAVRPWPLRILVLAGWLWLGWHLFVRVDWR